MPDEKSITFDPATLTLPRASAHEVRVVDEKKRTLRMIASDETVDSYNTIFLVGGWKLDRFMKNSVFLYAHNDDPAVPTLPIGRVVKIGAEQEGARKVLAAYVEFVDEAVYPFAGLVYRLYKDGFLRGVSVGFRNVKHRVIEDPKELAALGFTRPYGAVLEENELVELSAVPVPSNPNALLAEVGRARGLAKLPALIAAPSDDKLASDEGRAWFCAQLEEVRRALPAPCCESCATGGACETTRRPDKDPTIVVPPSSTETRATYDHLAEKLELILKSLPETESRISAQLTKLDELLARALSSAGGTNVPKPAAGRSALELALGDHVVDLARIRDLAGGRRQ